MPTRPCLDCGQLTRNGPRCPTCRADRDRARDQQRGGTSRRGYGSAWQHTARRLIANQPWCTYCGTTGDADNPLTVDHITPKNAGGTDDESNLQVLCRRHNSAKAGRPT